MNLVTPLRRLVCFAAASAAALVLVVPAQAASLLDGNEGTVKFLLGPEKVKLHRVFSKIAGDGKTEADFHAAADGKGATVVLMKISGGSAGLPTQIVGGFNPQSWSSSGAYNITLDDEDRTAFLFNLTTHAVQLQNLIGQGLDYPDQYSGQFQTLNWHGPTFGGGYDLASADSLEEGSAANFSYGGTSLVKNITSSGQWTDDFAILAIEVYTVKRGHAVEDGNRLIKGQRQKLKGLIGPGKTTFRLVFSKTAGDGKTEAAFHAAADGKGPTITLMKISGGTANLRPQIVGGFNPQSWSSSGAYNITLDDADRTAFLFNLTKPAWQLQNLIGEGLDYPDQYSGQFQTLNWHGPTFGGGYDLASSDSLEDGSASNFSYGGTSLVKNITTSGQWTDDFSIQRLEVYKVRHQPDAVDDDLDDE